MKNKYIVFATRKTGSFSVHADIRGVKNQKEARRVFKDACPDFVIHTVHTYYPPKTNSTVFGGHLPQQGEAQ